MAKIGNWGKVLQFKVSSEEIMTFSNMQRKVASRWAQHKIVQRATRSEYLGIDQSSITMDIVFSAEHGQRPYKCLYKLNQACKHGYVDYLYIGGKRVGYCKWYVESVSHSWAEIWSKGELVKATCKVTFKEYH